MASRSTSDRPLLIELLSGRHFPMLVAGGLTLVFAASFLMQQIFLEPMSQDISQLRREVQEMEHNSEKLQAVFREEIDRRLQPIDERLDRIEISSLGVEARVKVQLAELRLREAKAYESAHLSVGLNGSAVVAVSDLGSGSAREVIEIAANGEPLKPQERTLVRAILGAVLAEYDAALTAIRAADEGLSQAHGHAREVTSSDPPWLTVLRGRISRAEAEALKARSMISALMSRV